MPFDPKPAIFYILLAIFLSQNALNLVSLAKLEQPESHPEIPFACSFIQCSTFFDRSVWIMKKSGTTLYFADGTQVSIPTLDIADKIHINYSNFVFFLRLPILAQSPAGARFIKANFCEPADYVKPYLPSPAARPTRARWDYLSWDEKFTAKVDVACDDVKR